MKDILTIDGCRVAGIVLEQCLNAMAQNKPLLLMGPPASGKIMLARRLGMLRGGPFRAPHHTVSDAGMVGTHRHPRGECSLADGGVLLLDEMPEFRRAVLQHIAVAYQEKMISHYDREAESNFRVASDFYPIATAAACACSYTWSERACQCTVNQRDRYHARYDQYRYRLGFVTVNVTRGLRDSGPCIVDPFP